DRLKEYIRASCLKKELDTPKVVSCIADILKLEEERSLLTEPALKDILIVLESKESPQQLKEIFIGR
ncbi:MAG: hypothetical protein V1869_03145, partial [Candidatus Omnitrophota bacterium]